MRKGTGFESKTAEPGSTVIASGCWGLGMPDTKIRRAKEQDAPALSRCIDAAYSIYASRITDLPAVSEGIAADIENHLVWVAETERSIVGGLVLIPEDGFALLANIAVDPKWSGRGLGRRLLELMESECRKIGIRKVRLSTHVHMPENIRFYQGLGWRESGRSGNKVHMSKSIQDS